MVINTEEEGYVVGGGRRARLTLGGGSGTKLGPLRFKR